MNRKKKGNFCSTFFFNQLRVVVSLVVVVVVGRISALSDDTDGCGVPAVAGAAGVVTVASGVEATVAATTGAAAIDMVVTATPAPNGVPVVMMRVVVAWPPPTPEEFGPARTASETGWPLCRAADTCDSSAFC